MIDEGKLVSTNIQSLKIDELQFCLVYNLQDKAIKEGSCIREMSEESNEGHGTLNIGTLLPLHSVSK